MHAPRCGSRDARHQVEHLDLLRSLGSMYGPFFDDLDTFLLPRHQRGQTVLALCRVRRSLTPAAAR